MGRPRNKPIRLGRQIPHRDESGKYDGRFGWPGMMTIEAAADYLMISERKLLEIRRAGLIKAIRDGGNARYSRNELDRYIAWRESQEGAEYETKNETQEETDEIDFESAVSAE